MSKTNVLEKKDKNIFEIIISIILILMIVVLLSLIAIWFVTPKESGKLLFNIDDKVFATIEVDGKESFVMPNPEAKDGYSFGGWYFDKDTLNDPCTEKTIKDKNIKGDTNVYAKWTKDNYTITYVLDGGENAKANPITYAIDTATIILNASTKVGYTFGGWYGEDTFTTKVTEIAIGSTGNKTLFAKWTALEYDIIYELNGGVQPASYPKTYNIETGTTLAKPTKVGYTFNGWCTDAGLVNSIATIATGSTGAVNVYAKWTATIYPITYVLDGGSNNANNPATYTIEDSTIQLQAPTYNGDWMTFGGWFGDDTFKTQINEIATKPTGNKKVYAKWNFTGSPGLTYALTSDGQTYEVSVGTATGAIGIPSKHGNSPVKIADRAFKSNTGNTGNTSITSVVIQNGVTSIGNYAFKYCYALTSVVMQNGATSSSIGVQAFYDCTALTSVAISSGVTSIGYQAFKGCTSLASVNIPNGVTTIELQTFYNCTALTSVNIPSSVTNIVTGAFNGCTSLKSIFIPTSVTTMEAGVFQGCTNLTISCERAENPLPPKWDAMWMGDVTNILWSQTRPAVTP